MTACREAADAADSAALADIAADLRRWLAEELRRREAAQAPKGLRLVAFHRAALAEAWRTAATLVAGAASRAHWQIWLPDGDGGWAKREQDVRAALPGEALALDVRFSADGAWPLSQALVGDWRLAAQADGRRQEGLLRIAPWSGDDPPLAALRRGWLPARSDDERAWADAAAGLAVDAWLDLALAALAGEEA